MFSAAPSTASAAVNYAGYALHRPTTNHNGRGTATATAAGGRFFVPTPNHGFPMMRPMPAMPTAAAAAAAACGPASFPAPPTPTSGKLLDAASTAAEVLCAKILEEPLPAVGVANRPLAPVAAGEGDDFPPVDTVMLATGSSSTAAVLPMGDASIHQAGPFGGAPAWMSPVDFYRGAPLQRTRGASAAAHHAGLVVGSAALLPVASTLANAMTSAAARAVSDGDRVIRPRTSTSPIGRRWQSAMVAAAKPSAATTSSAATSIDLPATASSTTVASPFELSFWGSTTSSSPSFWA